MSFSIDACICFGLLWMNAAVSWFAWEESTMYITAKLRSTMSICRKWFLSSNSIVLPLVSLLGLASLTWAGSTKPWWIGLAYATCIRVVMALPLGRFLIGTFCDQTESSFHWFNFMGWLLLYVDGFGGHAPHELAYVWLSVWLSVKELIYILD